jgi:nitric oxide reductase activation protein
MDCQIQPSQNRSRPAISRDRGRQQESELDEREAEILDVIGDDVEQIDAVITALVVQAPSLDEEADDERKPHERLSVYSMRRRPVDDPVPCIFARSAEFGY